MSTFVDECRREWRRLGVPDSMAEEMASELEADLAEASADGVSATEVLGESDPRRFAANWASARGLVPDGPPRPRRRPHWAVFAAGVVVLLVGVILGGLLVVKGAHPTIHTQINQQTAVSAPDVVGMTELRAEATLEARGLQPAVAYVRHRPAGTVVVQVPAARTRVERGSTVLLRVGRAG